jgi:ribosome recycling factor
MIEDVLSELRNSTSKALEGLKRELGKLRTGRAHAGMLDGVRVEYYGQLTPISQMATISVPEPRLLMVKAWERSQVQAIDKALRESDLGLNPQSDGDLLRIPVPALSEQRRKELVKVARRMGEDHKVIVRKYRHECLDMLAELKQSGDASEDEVERAKKKAEEFVAEAGHAIDQIVQSKEKDILTV